MGKYNDELKRLQHQRETNRRLHNSKMGNWGYLMDDYAKTYNTSHFNIQEEYYARQIEAIEDKAREEMINEMTAEVLKRIDIQVKDNATPALKDLQKELSKLFK